MSKQQIKEASDLIKSRMLGKFADMSNVSLESVLLFLVEDKLIDSERLKAYVHAKNYPFQKQKARRQTAIIQGIADDLRVSIPTAYKLMDKMR